jgi:hypothetical protein
VRGDRGSDYVVTGDKHLLKLGQFARARIIKPADFLGELLQQGPRRKGVKADGHSHTYPAAR